MDEKLKGLFNEVARKGAKAQRMNEVAHKVVKYGLIFLAAKRRRSEELIRNG